MSVFDNPPGATRAHSTSDLRKDSKELTYRGIAATPRLVIPNTAKPIPLNVGYLDRGTVLVAAELVNERMIFARQDRLQGDLLDVYDIIDLRMLSGLMGELFSTAIAELDSRLVKNPDIDGYPDLCDISALPSHPRLRQLGDFRNFLGGGIEVKNTFGIQRPSDPIPPRAGRIGRIQPNLVWKAHHQYTSRLLALQSDYVGGIPQIVAAYFSAEITPDDWTTKQQPNGTSAMTSFTQTKPSALRKLKLGTLLLQEATALD